MTIFIGPAARSIYSQVLQASILNFEPPLSLGREEGILFKESFIDSLY